MIYNIYFSPTGSTQKVTSFLANQINTCTDVDLSLPKNNFSIKKVSLRNFLEILFIYY